jgi:hypothetical protein
MGIVSIAILQDIVLDRPFPTDTQDGGLLSSNFGSRHLLEGIFKNFYLKLLSGRKLISGTN